MCRRLLHLGCKKAQRADAIHSVRDGRGLPRAARSLPLPRVHRGVMSDHATAREHRTAEPKRRRLREGRAAVRVPPRRSSTPKTSPESADPCLSYTCDEQTEEPVVVNTASGVECAESLQCDGQGSCVTCVEDDDCQSDCQTAVCKCEDGGCVSATCTNGTKDGTETHLDCGGMLCNPCADTFNCIENSDCISKVCGRTRRAPCRLQ